MTSLLSVRDLKVEFVDRGRVTNRPIRGVDLELARGEVLGVVGETGCGKSLTGLSVLGLMPSGARTTGQVVFDGVDQLTAPASERAAMRGDAVSIVFQNPGTAFNPVFTIGAADEQGAPPPPADVAEPGPAGDPAAARARGPARPRPRGRRRTRTSSPAACCSGR